MKCLRFQFGEEGRENIHEILESAQLGYALVDLDEDQSEEEDEEDEDEDDGGSEEESEGDSNYDEEEEEYDNTIDISSHRVCLNENSKEPCRQSYCGLPSTMCECICGCIQVYVQACGQPRVRRKMK